MVGAARDAGTLGGIPVLEEIRVEMIAAFGRLDEGEADARLARRLPVDVALPIGDVDTLDRHGVSGGDAVMRLGVAQAARLREAIAGAERDQRRRHGHRRETANEQRHR
jgi:hypothetical protein